MKIGAVTSPLWNNENMITDHEYNTKKALIEISAFTF